MFHFPSSLSSSNPSSSGLPRRTDGLNATQQKSSSNPYFLAVEEELHDARRVHAHGQEEDLRFALNMVISRVTELTSLLGEAYKTQADLEVQLNVAKSNLQLVIANNEMLEEALKRDSSGQARDVGWRRTSGRESEAKERASTDSRSMDLVSEESSGSAVPSPTVPISAPPAVSNAQDNRFFKFRFSGSASSSPRPSSQPGTPALNGLSHLTSPSMPSLPVLPNKELEELTTQLEKERAARKSIADEKAALEDELESLSQALFEEANKMVATERMKRAETEEELNELRLEKEALRSALRLVEGEYSHLRGSASGVDTPSAVSPAPPSAPVVEMQHSLESLHSRSSSTVALKSPPSSPILLEEMAPESPPSLVVESELEDTLHHPPPSAPPHEESQRTPKYAQARLTSLLSEPSPWHNVSSPSLDSSLTLPIGTAQ